MRKMKKPLKFSESAYMTVKTEQETYRIPHSGKKVSISDICIEIEENGGQDDVYLTAEASAVEWIKIRWKQKFPRQVKILGDMWERGYGEFQWCGMSASRVMPWYFLASHQGIQWGYGVRVRPSAMCYWQADTRGITLFLDVRCGGAGVLLKGRRMKLAELVCLEAQEDAFSFAREFCQVMCQDPVFPKTPVYGSNNWYYAYGVSSEAHILKDTDYILELAKGAENPPYMVIDDCWQEHHRLNEYNGGPWRKGNSRFPDMKGLAEKMIQKGAKTGIWVRFLLNEEESIPDEWRLSQNGCLDPSHPEALEYVKKDVQCLCEWGFQLIKHDFSTYDLFGRWGFEMNPLVTGSGWHFYDRSKTSAEVVKDLYQAIYQTAVAYGTVIIGCNTIGHLGAGLMHVSRVGDDTSGYTWERTRKMGINSLAFRLPQHRTFFDVDADCVGITEHIPWKLNRQWADVIAESGTPLFISAKPGTLNEQEFVQLQEIIIKASKQKCHKWPEDWMDNDCPEIWSDGQETVVYDWYEDGGASLASKDEKFYANVLVP